MEENQTYTYEAAHAASLLYFKGDELATKVFLDKYALRNDKNELVELTPDDMHVRIAKEFARIEAKKFKKPLSFEEIYSLLKDFKYIIPQGSPMYGIGNKKQYVTLSNCYVLDTPLDSYTGIHWTDEQISHISKRRGGCGLDISELRPNKAPTRNSSRTSTGIIPFMERFSNSIREVGQDGRRGALMITLNVHHPQVLDFTTVKNDLTKVTGANISLKLTDEFLNAVENDTDYELRWPVEGKPIISQKVRARDVWQTIINNAHAMAEPGLIFWDNIIRNSPADCYAKFGFKTVSTNPCSELPLSILDSCRLLLLNLFSFVKNPFTKDAYFDYEEFYKIAKIAQRLMDDVVDLELEAIDRILAKIDADPEPDYLKSRERYIWEKIRQNCFNGRRTGTGITALGDTIAAINEATGIKYGSLASVDFSESIYQTLKFAAYESSIDMAEELGAFPVWDHELEKDNEFLNRFKNERLVIGSKVIFGSELYVRMTKIGRRNIALLTTAPAGTVSILTQTTSGIEPLFAMWFFRKKKGNLTDENFRVDFTDQNGDTWMEFKVYHPKLQMWMDITGETDPLKSPWAGACANDIDWVNRVELQAAITRHLDHSVSSTINLPNNVSVEVVGKIYTTAWKSGCKGITVYRDGCRTGVLTNESSLAIKEPQERPKKVPCDIHHVTVKGRQYFVLVGILDGKPYEVFAGKNGVLDKAIKHGIITKKKGKYILHDQDDEFLFGPVTMACDEHEEAISRLTSLSLRGGSSIDLIVNQLEKVNGEMVGFAKSLARALKKYIPDDTKVEGESCPECASPDIVRQEGCKTCKSCGWSKCL